MIDNPLTVKEGDTLNLLMNPVRSLTIPLVDVYRIIPSLSTAIERYKQQVFGSGLFLDKLNIRPTVMPLYDPNNVDELTRQTLPPHNQYELFPVIDNQLGDCVSVYDMLNIVKESSHPIMIKASFNGHGINIADAKEHHFYPTSISIALEMIRDAIQSHLLQLRPWMNVAIKTKPYIVCSLEEQERLIDAYIYEKQEIVDMLLNSQTRLISVIVSTHGITINLLCDVRVYLWTKTQEEQLDGHAT